LLEATVEETLVRELRSALAPSDVISDPAAQRRYLRDFSWYSPMLTGALGEKPADAVVRPRSVEELRRVLEISVRHRAPFTLRGAGTGNYGQSVPLEGGVLADVRGLNRVVEVTDDTIAVEPGVRMIEAENAARERGRELRVMPSTYHIATAAGWVAGGSGGIGSVQYGSLWDGNVLSAELLTAEDEPRMLALSGDELLPVLHTYGTVGVIARLTFPLVPARRWREAVAVFGSFGAAAGYAWDLARDRSLRKRLVSLQETPIPDFFEPMRGAFGPGESAVLLILEEGDLAGQRVEVEARGGRLLAWPEKPRISQFPFSHTILWAKKRLPDSTWLQLRFAADGFLSQMARIKERFGGALLHHVEFHGGGEEVVPFGIPVVTEGEAVDDIMAFCEGIGVSVLNPHTYVVEEGGYVGDIGDVIALKRETDPHGLLNPGKIGRSFYTARAG